MNNPRECVTMDCAIPEAYVRKIGEAGKAGKLSLFLGSGISRPAFPSWDEFVRKAIALVKDNGSDVDDLCDNSDLVAVISACKERLNDDAQWLGLYDECFSKSITTGDIGDIYRHIGCLRNINHIITTNYDCIPSILWPGYGIYCNTDDEISTIKRRTQAQALSGKPYRYVLKIHGCHTRPNTMVVTENDYNKICNNEIVKDFIRDVLTNELVLFVGYGFEDDNIDRILKSLNMLYKGRILGAYAILPNISDSECNRYLRQFNVRTLNYVPTNNDDHGGIISLLNDILPVEVLPSTDARSGSTVKARASRATQSSLSDSGDISRLLLFNKAFSLNGSTKIIYTCRSFFNKPEFICPSKNEEPNLKKSRTIRSHIPVDEVETYGLCCFWYGLEVLGTKEGSAENSTICSKISSQKLAPVVNWPPKEGQGIDKDLTKNLLIIGENQFSNNVFPLISHLVPWRHIVTKSVNETRIQRKEKYHVKPSYVDVYGNKIEGPVIDQISSAHHSWGIITLVPNPFAPQKWMLFLIGCSRPGQYLLLSWLRDRSSEQILSNIIKHKMSNDNNHKYIQVVVRGDRIDKAAQGQIDREWNDLTIINDIANKTKTPFFCARKPYVSTPNQATTGDEITDVSLVARVEKDQISSITGSLPESIKHLLDEESNNSNIGFHVTLYEFLHKRGWEEQGFASALLKRRDGFLACLRDRFLRVPPINIAMRQTRLTSISLQILVDIHMDMKNASLSWKESITDELNAMDFIVKYCHEAKEKLPNEKKDRLNINDSPFPLHLTLLRFNEATSLKMREDAEKWAKRNKLKIWGKAENLSLILTHAKESPFQDVTQVQLR